MGDIIYTVIVAYVSLIFIGIGISQCKSKKPVGFWTGIPGPDAKDVTDVTAYNKKHGWMFICYGAQFIIGCIPLFLVDNENMEMWIMVIESIVWVGGVIAMMIGHKYLEKKYVCRKS